MSAATSLEKIIAGKVSGTFCRFFNNSPWRDRELVLTELGFNPIPTAQLHEVSRCQAESHLAHSLAIDLCYGVKTRALSTASDIASEFTSRLHFQARYFINTNEPLSGKFTGSFSPLSNEATIDTGVMAKVGKEFAGLLWVFSVD